MVHKKGNQLSKRHINKWHFLSFKTVILPTKHIIMITKEQLYKQIESFPEKINIEELIDRLLLINKIESRITESDENKTISEEKLDNEIASWSN